jgi:hypothetical protein
VNDNIHVLEEKRKKLEAEVNLLKAHQQLIKDNPEKIVEMLLSDESSLFPKHQQLSLCNCKETKINFTAYDDILNGFDPNKMPYNEDAFEIDPSMYKSQELKDYVILMDESQRRKRGLK